MPSPDAPNEVPKRRDNTDALYAIKPDTEPTSAPAGSGGWQAALGNAEVIGENLVIYVEPPQEMTAGGIVIPDRARKHLSVGRIVAVGRAISERWKAYKLEIPNWVGKYCKWPSLAGTTIYDDKDGILVLLQFDDVGYLSTKESTSE